MRCHRSHLIALLGFSLAITCGLPCDGHAVESERAVRANIDREGQKLLQAYTGRPISAAAAKRFLQKLSSDLTIMVFEESRWWLDIHAKNFAEDARPLIDDYLRKTGPARLRPDPISAAPSGLPEPALLKEWTVASPEVASYRAVHGKLQVGPARVDELVQGDVGDCYFVAALSSLVERDPRFASRIIRPGPNGTFSAHFFSQADWRASPKPVEISVDSLLPVRRGHLLGCRDQKQQKLWPAILEKMWAAFKGGYDNATSGIPPDVFFALTGRHAETLPVFPDSNPEDIYRFIRTHAERGDAMTAETYGRDAQGHMDPLANYDATQLISDHAYSLLGWREVGGQPFVLLRNPWGHTEPLQANGKPLDGIDDGKFALSLAEFLKYFAEVDSLPVSPADRKDQRGVALGARSQPSISEAQ